jgi:putative transposase
VNASRLVFIDETWTKTNMTRLLGWAPKGRRLVDKVPHGHWKTATSLPDRGALPVGPINGERFLAYVEQFLVPTLRPEGLSFQTILGHTRERRRAPPSRPLADVVFSFQNKCQT